MDKRIKSGIIRIYISRRKMEYSYKNKTSIYLISMVLLFSSLLIILPESEVSGLTVISMDTTWSSDQFINDDIEVASGVTLWIDPGVSVYFNGPFYLGIKGNLYANGTKQLSINFTSGQPVPAIGDWFRLVFYPNSNGTLNWVNVEYADTGMTIASSGIVVQNTTVSHISGTGLEIVASQTQNIIKKCTVNDTNNGIVIESGSDNNELLNNTIFNSNSNGIYLLSSSNNNITNNNVSSNGWYGIHLDSSSNNEITDNNVSLNVWEGITLESSSNNNTITGNTVSNSIYGIWLQTSSNNTIRGNDVLSSVFFGIYLDSSSDNRILSNNVFDNNIGISLSWSSNNNIITNNNASLNYWNGIDLSRSSSNNTIAGNMVWKNGNPLGGDGIRLSSSNDNTIRGSNISSNAENGIRLSSSSNNTLAGNNVSNNRCGISFKGSNSTISNNLISESQLGMHFVSSSNPNIYTTQIIDSSVTSVFTDTGSSPRFYNCTLSSIPGSYLDIIVGNDGGQNVAYLGNGDGTITVPPKFGTGSDSTSSVALGYLDSDSILDVVVGNNGGQNVVYMGDGDGTFDTTSYNFGTGSDATTCVVLGDMNGDTILDIVVGNNGEQNVIYLGDGDGTFDSTSYNFGTGNDATTCIALGKLDGDSDLDIVVGNYGEVNAVYYNLGGGTFMLVDNLQGHTDATTSVALGDVDDQGDLDVVIGNYGGQNRAYLNMGAFLLSDNFGTGIDATTSVAFGDMNHDTYLDIIVGNDGEQNVIYVGDADGTFDTTSYNFGTGSDATTSIALGEVDDNWPLDIVVGNDGEQNVVYFGELIVAFTKSYNFGTGSDATASIALGEVNNYETDFYIDGDSHPWVLNTTFNKTAVACLDAASNLTVNWYIHANVVDVYYTGVGSATLWVNDSLETPKPRGPFTTDASGWAKWIVVTEYVENATNGKFYHTPHNASAREGFRFGYTVVNMTSSGNVVIILDRFDFQIPLVKGWNMISVPMNQSNASLSKVLQSISGKYDAVRWYNASDTNDHLKHFMAAKVSTPFESCNDLHNITHRMGIWILMEENDVLNLVGRVPIPTTTMIQLKKGWNFVGYPSLTPRLITDALSGIPYDVVMQYNASQAMIDPWKSTRDGDLTVMRAGEGYWIHVKSDCTWSVDW